MLGALKRDGILGEDDVLKVRADARTGHGKVELHPLALIAKEQMLRKAKKDLLKQRAGGEA